MSNGPTDRGRFLEKHPERDLRDAARSLRDFDRIADGLDVEQWRRGKSLASARASVRQLLAGYARAVSLRAYYADARVFGHGMARPAVDAIWMLTIALVTPGERLADGDIAAAVRLVLGGDPASQSFRAALSGQPWTGAPGGRDDLVPIPGRSRRISTAARRRSGSRRRRSFSAADRR
jgi:hypothetical protein